MVSTRMFGSLRDRWATEACWAIDDFLPNADGESSSIA